MKSKFLIILILVVILTACQGIDRAPPAPSDQNAQPVQKNPDTEIHTSEPEFIPGDCPFPLDLEYSQKFTPECGFLVVSEDHTDPGSNRIKLAVAWFHQPNDQTGDIPVVFIDGGPGISTLESLPYSIPKFLPLLNEHDVIFYDQRGTGYSEPALDCPEHDEFVRQSLEEKLTLEETISRQFEIFEECHSRLVDRGINLEMYNSLQSAHDVEALRLVLGIDQWDLYSVSYGTRVALEVLRQHPEGVRSVILDSVLPPDADPISESVTNVGQALENFFEACNGDTDCSAAFPDLEAMFYSTAEALNQEPALVPVANLLTGAQFNSIVDGKAYINIITQSLYSSEVIPIIPMMISEVSQGDYQKLSSLRSSFISSGDFLSHGKYYSVLCHQEAPFSNPGKVVSAIQDRPRLEDYFATSISHGSHAFEFCEMWDAGKASPEQNEPVSSSIPTLVIAGGLDPSTPSRWSQHAVQNLENGYFIEIETAGHSSSLSLPCPHSIAIEFLEDPLSEPDCSCISEIKLQFAIPTQLDEVSFVNAEVPEHGIQAAVPEGWIAVKPEYFVPPDKSVELVISKNSESTIDDFRAQWNATELLGTTSINQLDWEIYSFKLPAKDAAGFIATSPGEDGFYFVLIVGKSSHAEALFQKIFLPVLQSYTIAE